MCRFFFRGVHFITEVTLSYLLLISDQSSSWIPCWSHFQKFSSFLKCIQKSDYLIYFFYLFPGNARCVRRMVYNTTHPIACGVAWQWSGDHRHDWHTYDMEVMAFLEDAFSRKASILDLSMTSCKLPYTLDLKHLQQVRNETGFARKIRRMQLVTPYPKDNSNNKTPSLVTPVMNGIPVPGLPGGKKHAHSDSSADSSPDGNPPINHLKHQHKKKSTGMGRGSLKSLAVSSVGAGSSASYLQPSPSTSSGSASMMSASVLSASVSQSSSSTSFGYDYKIYMNTYENILKQYKII